MTCGSPRSRRIVEATCSATLCSRCRTIDTACRPRCTPGTKDDTADIMLHMKNSHKNNNDYLHSKIENGPIPRRIRSS